MPADDAPRPPPLPRAVVGAFGFALAVAALHFGRDILVPFALAALLGFLLDPLVVRLRRGGLPRAIAIALVVSSTVAVVGGVSAFVGGQLVQLGHALPGHQDTVRAKLRALRQAATGGRMLDDANRMLGVLGTEVDAARRALAPARTAAAPMRVQVEPTPPSTLGALTDLLAPVVEPLAGAGLVLVFTIFILLERTELRDRVLRLAGGDLRRTTDALNDAARRVSRYLAMQLLVNLSYGLPMALGLWLIGVPGAVLWGLLAAVLRFVPYVGPVVAAAFPLTIAFAVDPGWNLFLWTAALVIVIELVSNQLVEPWLYGASTGISPVALLVSAAFWAALWGPVGLVLATPLTVCLVVMGRHLKPLRIFDLMLGSAPVFDPPTRLYQRLLSGDAEEAIEIAGDEVRRSSLAAFYGDTALPALRIASAEHARLQAEHRHRLACGFETLLRELRAEHPPAAAASGIWCIGLRSEADALGADMLAHVLGARTLPAAVVSAAHIGTLDLDGAAAVVLCSFNPEPEAHARFVVRRLKRRQPGLRVVVAAWSAPAGLSAAALEADALAGSLPEAVAAVQGSAVGGAPAAAAALRRTDRPTVEPLLHRLVDVFDADAAMVAWAEPAAVQSHGRADDALARALLGAVLAADDAVLVPDLTRETMGLDTCALGFAAAVPLRHGSGIAGALCIAGRRARRLQPQELSLLASLASGLMAETCDA